MHCKAIDQTLKQWEPTLIFFLTNLTAKINVQMSNLHFLLLDDWMLKQLNNMLTNFQ